jgi:TP901 family phage tail tape measure protein
MRLDASQFDKSVKQSQAELQAFARTAGALPGGRNSVFGALATDVSNLAPALSSMPLAIAAVGAALTGAGLAARRAGVEFEASLTKIATLGDDAQQNLNATRQAILDTYSSTAVTGGVTDLAEANYLLQSSGRSAAEAIVDLDIAARASVAGYTDVTTAVDGLTTVTAAWKDTQISTAQASDILFAAVNVGKASFEQIASSLGLVAPLAASAGVRFEEVAAATAVLSNQGLRTTSIMEGMRSAILNIQRPTEDFKKKYADLAREFGASRLARDGIIKFLQDFDKESGGSRAALGALFSDATALTTALGLLRNGGNDAAAALEQMRTAAGAADDALVTVNQSAKAQEQLVRNQISSAWTQFGELLNTTTLPILEAVARVMNRISNGASFAAKDVQDYLKSGSTNALLSLAKQSRDNPAQFLNALSTDEIKALRTKLLGDERNRFNIDGSLVATLGSEVTRREGQARTDARRTAAAAADARAAAGARASDEEAQRTREASATATAEAKREAERVAKELARERQRLVEDAAKLTRDLEASAIEATQGTIGALQAAMQQTLSEGAALLKRGVLSPEASAALRSQLEQFEGLQTEMINAEQQAVRTQQALDAALNQDELPSLQTLAAREQELQVILEGTTNLAARKKLEEQLAALAKARGDRTGDLFDVPAKDELQNNIALIGDLAQSIATVGDQLDLLPRRAVDAIRGIGALAEQGAALQRGWGALGTLGKVGAGIGIAGGVASLAAALFSESPEDKQRRDELRANTDALRTLTSRVGDLAGSGVSGSNIARITGGTTTLLGGLRDAGGIRINNLPAAIAAAAGVTTADVTALASSLGVVLNGTYQSLVQFRDALRTADLAAYTNTFAGSLERLNDTIRADGISDPIEILRRRIAVLSDASTGFPALAAALEGVDLSTVEGRSTAGDRARALFDQVQGGTLSASQFGGLSLTDARTQLLDLITGLRDANAGSGTGGFNETRTITEVTGSRLAGLLGSANTFLARIADDIATLRAALVVGPPVVLTPPSLGALGSSSGTQIVFSGGITVQITLTRDMLGGDAGAAIAMGESFGQAVGQAVGRGAISEIDAQLRERALRQRLLTGDARLAS